MLIVGEPAAGLFDVLGVGVGIIVDVGTRLRPSESRQVSLGTRFDSCSLVAE